MLIFRKNRFFKCFLGRVELSHIWEEPTLYLLLLSNRAFISFFFCSPAVIMPRGGGGGGGGAKGWDWKFQQEEANKRKRTWKKKPSVSFPHRQTLSHYLFFKCLRLPQIKHSSCRKDAQEETSNKLGFFFPFPSPPPLWPQTVVTSQADLVFESNLSTLDCTNFFFLLNLGEKKSLVIANITSK